MTLCTHILQNSDQCKDIQIYINLFNMEYHIEELDDDTSVFPKFRAPATFMVSGVTSSGKSTLTHKLLKNKDNMFDRPVHKVLYCYGVDQPLFIEMQRTVPGIQFKKGLPTEADLDTFSDGSRHCIVVLDDLMERVVRDVDIQNLFLKISHHRSMSTLFITQNMYAQGKCSRNISMNVLYFFILCNPRDVGQISTLAKQTGLGETLKESYKDCVLKKSYSYIVVDLHPASLSMHTNAESPRLQSRIHTNIFPGETLISYV